MTSRQLLDLDCLIQYYRKLSLQGEDLVREHANSHEDLYSSMTRSLQESAPLFYKNCALNCNRLPVNEAGMRLSARANPLKTPSNHPIFAFSSLKLPTTDESRESWLSGHCRCCSYSKQKRKHFDLCFKKKSLHKALHGKPISKIDDRRVRSGTVVETKRATAPASIEISPIKASLLELVYALERKDKRATISSKNTQLYARLKADLEANGRLTVNSTLIRRIIKREQLSRIFIKTASKGAISQKVVIQHQDVYEDMHLKTMHLIKLLSEFLRSCPQANPIKLEQQLSFKAKSFDFVLCHSDTPIDFQFMGHEYSKNCATYRAASEQQLPVHVFVDFSNYNVGAKVFLEELISRDQCSYDRLKGSHGTCSDDLTASASDSESDLDEATLFVAKPNEVPVGPKLVHQIDPSMFEVDILAFLKLVAVEAKSCPCPKRFCPRLRLLEQVVIAGSCRPLRSAKVIRDDFREKESFLPNAHVLDPYLLSDESCRPSLDFFPKFIKHIEILNLQRVYRDGQYHEQGVDEILQSKMLKVIVEDFTARGSTTKAGGGQNMASLRGTICLLTGDGKPSEFGLGFIPVLLHALALNWRVEVYSWRSSLSQYYYCLLGHRNFSFVPLDLWANLFITVETEVV